MPNTAVELRPGVDTQKTQSANIAGISVSQLIRWDEGMPQTLGGWTAYGGGLTIASTVRDIHAWQGIGVSHAHVAFGARASLTVFHSDDNSQIDVTPQTYTSNPAPNFSLSSGSSLVTVVDGGSSASVYNTVFFNTPVSLGGAGGYLLNGAYPIPVVTASSVYQIPLGFVSSFTLASSGAVPRFAVSSGSAVVTVTLSNNAFTATPGLFRDFIATTTVGGLTIQGPYLVNSVVDSTNFTISESAQSSIAASSVSMNGGNAQLVYHITIGPQLTGSGWGGGGWGSGGWGTGTTLSGGTGTPITTTNWTLDNWGEILLACPVDGAIYIWSTNGGLTNAQVISQAPFFNGGIFVAMPQQILVAWRSTQSTGVQDPLIVRWCDAGDYTNWTVGSQSTAGSFHIPTGTRIIGGIQGPTVALISTDVSVWVMTYAGGEVTFNFLEMGRGCGWIGPHAAGVLNGTIWWCSEGNFYRLGSTGVEPVPCSVWDFIFQNLNDTNQTKVRCAVNSIFNEIMWLFPSENATECDSYVKLHVEGNEFEWDYGALPRTAWIDVSVAGRPIAADTAGAVWQHDTSDTITGVSLPSFTTGWWTITEGNDMAFVDQIIPDFKWGQYSAAQNAQVNLTFYAVDFPGGAMRTYGPYTVTQATQYINTLIRGRLMSMQATAINAAFWRLGRIRYRYRVDGRR